MTDASLSGLAVGTQAPGFTLRDQFGQDISLDQFRGRKSVLLFFYPAAFTGVCTSELAGLRDRLDEFMTFDTEVLAVSCDPMFSLRTFADVEGLNFPLLSDFWPHGEVTRAYGVFDEQIGQPRRSSYVVDSDGVIRWGVHNSPPQGRDLDEHLRELLAAA